MKNNNIIMYQKVLSINRRGRLYCEFRYAWQKTSKKQKIKWCKESLKLFLKVTIRRGKGFVNAIKYLIKKTSTETKVLAIAIYNKNGIAHLQKKKEVGYLKTKDAYKNSKEIGINLIRILRYKPKEAGPVLFLGLLGFFCGAGFIIGEKTWYDIDGGIPDLDWKIGEITGLNIMHHRSIITHSIISAAMLETIVFSSISAINMIHNNLPDNHDSFWDKILVYNDWGKAFAIGACTGIAYHLLLDGTLDGGGSYSGLPSMPQWAHQTIALSNSSAEAIDLNKKNINV